MKQNKDREEFQKYIDELTKDYEYGLTVEDENNLWNFFQSYTHMME